MLRGSIAAALVASALLFVPGAEAAEPPKTLFEGVFELRGTNGYEAYGIVGSDGAVGTVRLTVFRSDGEATYSARGEGTADSVDIDLGRLGRIDVEARPSGVDETFRTGCGGRGKPVTVPGSELVGTIEFHGEGGFTEVEATRAPLSLEPLLRPACSTTGVTGGDRIGGALIHATAPGGPSVVLQQNHPGARVFYQAKEHEREGTVEVARTVGGHLGAGALRYAPALASASFSAAAPFSGAATYVERSTAKTFDPGRSSWLGSLKVDFPGDPGVHLAGPDFKATIVHAHRVETHE